MKLHTVLSKKRKLDEFLPIVTSIFISTKWFGIPVYGGKRFLCLAIIFLLMLSSIEIMAIWKLLRAVTGLAGYFGGEYGVTARLSGAIFYANTLTSFILTWRLLRTWKRSAYWLRIEIKGLYLQPDRNIKRRVTFVAWFVGIGAFVEHGLSMMSATGLDCPPSEYFSRYIMISHNFMLHSNEYSLWVAIPIFITSTVATILWNLQDLIVILISMGLASRYHRLNLYIRRFVKYETDQRGKRCSTHSRRVTIWRKLREAYVKQAALVRKVDTELGCLTILCNLNNFFFICLQLYLILRKSDGTIVYYIYHITSLGWLAFRASSVFLAAADINLHSKLALKSIYKSPSSGYNVEIKRLKYLLINDEVCLTGLGIFGMKRQTLLEVAAAIVKYELILLNFDT